MAYRGPDPTRIAGQQADAIFLHAGQTAIWRQYVSASAGNANALAAGIGSAPAYREQTVTALFGAVQSTQGFQQPERATPAGMLAAGEILATVRERPGRQDELVWNGVIYRVESDAVPARIAGTWTVTLKRGTG